MRALGIILDSVGCGYARDADAYGDSGADTLGKIFTREKIQLPNLARLGLYDLLRENHQSIPLSPDLLHGSQATRLHEASAGKDTTTGHWEIAGAITTIPFATFPTFPPDLIAAIEERADIKFIGNVISSGTAVIEDFGEQHLVEGKPILYTSVDSVMQIAAHEESFGLERLYAVCRCAREVIDERGIRIGRVIARPFLGAHPQDFTRTAGRRDFSLTPPRLMMQDLQDQGIDVIGIGKIADIFNNTGITESHPTKSNADGMKYIEKIWRENRQQSHFIFANLVDFDMLYGHRRDAVGYARALEQFDAWLGNFLPEIRDEDFLFITADHGNDPYFPGTDHTRESVPLLTLHATMPLRQEENFTYVAELVKRHFGIS